MSCICVPDRRWVPVTKRRAEADRIDKCVESVGDSHTKMSTKLVMDGPVWTHDFSRKFNSFVNFRLVYKLTAKSWHL